MIKKYHDLKQDKKKVMDPSLFVCLLLNYMCAYIFYSLFFHLELLIYVKTASIGPNITPIVIFLLFLFR